MRIQWIQNDFGNSGKNVNFRLNLTLEICYNQE